MVENDHGADVTARSFTPMADTWRQRVASLDSAAHPSGDIDAAATAKAGPLAVLTTALAKVLAPVGARLATTGARCRP